MYCKVEGAQPISIVWSKANENLGNQSNVIIQDSTIYFRNVDIADRGVYICTAENAGGFSRDSAIVEVESREQPQLRFYPDENYKVVVGGSALFQCMVVAGIPSPTVTWQRIDRRKFENNMQLLDNGAIRISDVTLSNQGQYECIAENIAGVTRGTFNLIVQSPPTIEIQPGGIVNVQEGEGLFLRCMSTGEPRPSITWEKMDGGRQRLLQSDQYGSAVHMIRSVTKADEGNYLCKASNEAGINDDIVLVVVSERGQYIPPPPPPPLENPIKVENSILDVPLGSKVEMRCLVVGQFDEPLAIKWKRMDGMGLPANSYEENGVLTIPAVTTSDNGVYICECFTLSDKYIAEAKSELRISQAPKVGLYPASQVVRPGMNHHRIRILSGLHP